MSKRSCFYDLKIFDKKTAGGAIKNKIKQNEQLAGELHKPIIKNFKKGIFIISRQYLRC